MQAAPLFQHAVAKGGVPRLCLILNEKVLHKVTGFHEHKII